MARLPQEIILSKRLGNPLTEKDIQQLVKGLTDRSFSDAQIAALAMAVYFQGMSVDERYSLTTAMRDSGDVLDWSNFAPKALISDKHSTGGVGDLTSLAIGPIVAACGGYVPMISGRGLGHTGGTLDKLSAIPGYQTDISIEEFQRVVEEVGVAIIGQTSNLAPADKRFYAIRDVTATVDSIPLISASILSKKLAAGLCSLVLDIKTGNGAFMDTAKRAKELANSLVHISEKAGVKAVAQITDMSQPLASCAGNALEIKETLKLLRGECDNKRLRDVTLTLSAHMLTASGLSPSFDEAMTRATVALESKQALEKFAQMVAALGGPDDFIDNEDKYLAKAAFCQPVYCEQVGYITDIDTVEIGMVVVHLGGGRIHPDDDIDVSVGLENLIELGQFVDTQTPLAIVHANSPEQIEEASRMLKKAISIDSEQQPLPTLLQDVIQG